MTDLNNVVVWMVSTLPPIYNTYSPFTKPLEIVPNAPVITGITVTFMSHIIVIIIIIIIIFFVSFHTSIYLPSRLGL